jgi:adenosylcobinamide kinase / adenosylcobinamide-phosphate guanylyltransferase
MSDMGGNDAVSLVFRALLGSVGAMSKIILVTGGARSGKSAIAEGHALGFTGRAAYIATAQAFDAEMEQRIALHRDRRDQRWTNLEAPLDLVDALDRSDTQPRLVDCLTLWLSNLMLAGHDWQAAGERLVAALARQGHPVVLVTNEVGLGIVPDNALARAFRDAAGLLNQRVAALADAVYLAVAGLPMKVK